MTKSGKRSRSHRTRKEPSKRESPETRFVRDAELKEAAHQDVLGGADLEHCMRMRG